MLPNFSSWLQWKQHPDSHDRHQLLKSINEQIQNIAQKKDTLCRRMYN